MYYDVYMPTFFPTLPALLTMKDICVIISKGVYKPCRVSVYKITTSRIEYEHIIYYCLWKDARIAYNLKSCSLTHYRYHILQLSFCSYDNKHGDTTSGYVTLLVINVILIVDRKRHPPTVQYDKYRYMMK